MEKVVLVHLKPGRQVLKKVIGTRDSPFEWFRIWFLNLKETNIWIIQPKVHKVKNQSQHRVDTLEEHLKATLDNQSQWRKINF